MDMKPMIQNLKHLTKCPGCDKTNSHTKALVLDEDSNKTTLHITCDMCKVSTLIFVSSGKTGIVSFGMMTDLSRNEVKKLFKTEAVSVDQVIEIHEFLKEFNGSIKEFL